MGVRDEGWDKDKFESKLEAIQIAAQRMHQQQKQRQQKALQHAQIEEKRAARQDKVSAAEDIEKQWKEMENMEVDSIAAEKGGIGNGNGNGGSQKYT